MDFYCEGDGRDTIFWLSGISYQMRSLIDPKFPLYSVGRALWKMACLKSNTQKLSMAVLDNESKKEKNLDSQKGLNKNGFKFKFTFLKRVK